MRTSVQLLHTRAYTSQVVPFHLPAGHPAAVQEQMALDAWALRRATRARQDVVVYIALVALVLLSITECIASSVPLLIGMFAGLGALYVLAVRP